MKTKKYILLGILMVVLIGYLVMGVFYRAIETQSILYWVASIFGLGVLIYIITFIIKCMKSLEK